MGELSIKDVNTLLNKSISHKKKSLYYFSDALIKFEWTVKEQKNISKFDYLEVKRQIRKQKHFVVELNRLAERKRKLLKFYMVNKKTNH
ncbi:hypothetical protein [Peribacillus tepidiphilus]|uniref:hypothetical protein n=1 Tax=Peribacillus tepidiphilus TaxID=2652445 RepID=UPI0035B51011